jgi:hypothetical protein
MLAVALYRDEGIEMNLTECAQGLARVAQAITWMQAQVAD